MTDVLKNIYLDHAATTALSEKAFQAMQPYLREQFGNPGGIYSYGVQAKKAVNRSRKKIAALLYGLDRTYHLKNIDPKDWIGEKDNG